MIKELTIDQVSKFPEYVEKWISIGCSTERFTNERASEIINNLNFALFDAKSEIPVFVVENPKEAYALCCALSEADDIKKVDIETAKLKPVKDFVYPYLDGAYSASVFSIYDYFIRETDIVIEEKLLKKYLAWQATSELGIIYLFDNFAVVSQKPKAMKKNENGDFHCEDGPALEFWGENIEPMYALNGVRVPKYLVETPAEQLSMEFYKNEKNADVRTEFVRKYGIDRMISMGTIIDSYKNYSTDVWIVKSEYELVDMKKIFPNIAYAPHLKMVNQTTGVIHVEAVSPNCRTIKQALNERFGGDFEILSIS